MSAVLFSTQRYKRIKGKMEQSREWRQLNVVAIEKGTFGSPSTKVANFTYLFTQPIRHRMRHKINLFFRLVKQFLTSLHSVFLLPVWLLYQE